MKDEGFLKIGDWHFNENGKLEINYPSSISNLSGVIAIIVNNELTFFGSTSHYGPRIKDFKSSAKAATQSTRIHSNILKALEANKTVSLWVKNSPSPATEKGVLLRTYNPAWNL